MNSLTRSWMTSQPARMQSGIRKVVRITNSTEMPSTPSLNLITSSQLRCSTNWKPPAVVSKLIQMNSDTMKVTIVVHSATQRALSFASGLRKPMMTAPTSGRNMTIDRSGAEARSI